MGIATSVHNGEIGLLLGLALVLPISTVPANTTFKVQITHSHWSTSKKYRHEQQIGFNLVRGSMAESVAELIEVWKKAKNEPRFLDTRRETVAFQPL